jgi:uncharacterized membrane protein YbhN (UPF0104 family)
MRERLRAWWPVLKAVLVVAVLAGVAWFFVGILRNEQLRKPGDERSPGQVLWDQARSARPDGLLVGGALYLVGLAFSGAFWLLLMRRAGEPLSPAAAARVYYIAHLGKYAPLGKGWALLLRTTLSASAGCRPGVAALTATYETLTTMAGGALLACAVIALQPAEYPGLLWPSLGLLALAGLPILPGIFDRLIVRSARRFGFAGPLPHFGPVVLLGGLALTACGWALLGASLAALLHALAPQPLPWDAGLWLRCTAAAAVSWVAGFVAFTPGGLGVREFVLQQFLARAGGIDDASAVVVVLLLRVLWTVAELLAAGALWLVHLVRLAAAPAPATASTDEDKIKRADTPPTAVGPPAAPLSSPEAPGPLRP